MRGCTQWRWHSDEVFVKINGKLRYLWRAAVHHEEIRTSQDGGHRRALLLMQRFRSMKTLQKFSSVHAQIHNHFNQERHFVSRNAFKQRRADAMVE